MTAAKTIKQHQSNIQQVLSEVFQKSGTEQAEEDDRSHSAGTRGAGKSNRIEPSPAAATAATAEARIGEQSTFEQSTFEQSTFAEGEEAGEAGAEAVAGAGETGIEAGAEAGAEAVAGEGVAEAGTIGGEAGALGAEQVAKAVEAGKKKVTFVFPYILTEHPQKEDVKRKEEEMLVSLGGRLYDAMCGQV